MTEGTLYANVNYRNYMLGSPEGPDVIEGQAVEVFLGGHWIPGHIHYSHPTSSIQKAQQQKVQDTGAYQLTQENALDTVDLSSELSFPASDPPAIDDEQPQARVVGGYYFRANADGSVCGLCIGMRIKM